MGSRWRVEEISIGPKSSLVEQGTLLWKWVLQMTGIIQLTSVPGKMEMQVHQPRHVGRRARVLNDRLSS